VGPDESRDRHGGELIGRDMPVMAGFESDEPDPADVGEVAHRVHEGVDQVVLAPARAPAQQHDVDDLVGALVQQFAAASLFERGPDAVEPGGGVRAPVSRLDDHLRFDAEPVGDAVPDRLTRHRHRLLPCCSRRHCSARCGFGHERRAQRRLLTLPVVRPSGRHLRLRRYTRPDLTSELSRRPFPHEDVGALNTPWRPSLTRGAVRGENYFGDVG
jgi:hypothetical protein